LSVELLATVADPAELLDWAQTLEPWSRYTERTTTLDRLEELLDADAAPPAPPGRDWRLELQAERAIDIGRNMEVAAARALADEVLSRASPAHERAIARALLALGQALAWSGTEDSVHQSDRAFLEAAERFAALGRADWQGSALVRCGYSTHFQYGDLRGAEELIRQALECWEPGSQRYVGTLDCYADVLTDLGELDRAEEILDEAEAAVRKNGDQRVLGTIREVRGRIAAARGDAAATERIFYEAEVELSGTDWFESVVGGTLFLEAAVALDRLGLTHQANLYLERSYRWAVGGDPNNDEGIMLVKATMLARTGPPQQALDALQELYRQTWLQKRLVWNHTLMMAWATLRAGNPHDAGVLAARALEQAVAAGSIKVALTAEPDITAALAPLAEQAGSSHARELLLDGRELLVRLFGSPGVTRADGTQMRLPAGKPGELVRWLALVPHGVPVDVVLETFFPDTPPSSGRPRLRQTLARLRRSVGDLVIREGDNLRLVPAWVDVAEFLRLAERSRSARQGRAVLLAHSALALQAGALLPGDLYAPWAEEARAAVEHHHDLLVERIDAVRPGI
jgi:tetratricopeptide (TPR) repeat protein